MKAFYFLICIVLLFSCHEENDYVVEDILYQCLVDEFKVKGVDLETELLRFETFLIEPGVLESNTSASYHLLFNKLSTGKVHIVIDLYEFKELNEFYNDKLSDSSIGCVKGVDSVVIKKSHHYKSQMAIVDFYKSKNITEFNSAIEVYNSIVTVKDYIHPYYRSKVLIASFYIANIEAGIPKSIPVDLQKKSNSNSCLDCECMTLTVNEKSELIYERKVIDLVKANYLIREITPKCEVLILGSKKASYQSIFEVISLVKNLDGEFKNLESLELFGVSYDELSESKKEEVCLLASCRVVLK